MKQNDALEQMINSSFGDGLTSFTRQTPQREQTKESVKESVPTRAKQKITSSQMRAVEKAQNANRGRGKKIEGRSMVSFKTPLRVSDAIQQIHYDTGKTLTDLYEEALLDLIAKYGIKI